MPTVVPCMVNLRLYSFALPRWVNLFFICCFFCSFATRAADAARFDALIEQYEQGELVFVDRAAVEQFARQLESYLPPNDKDRALRLKRELCTVDFIDNPQEGIAYANQFINDPDLQQNRLLLSHFYLCRATHYSFTNELQLQEADLEQAVELARQSEDKLTLANALSARADMYSFRGQSADSLVLLFEAHQLYKSLAHRFGIGNTVQSIGTSFRRMGEFEQAIHYLELSEAEFNRPDDGYRLAFLLQQKAFAYAELGKTAKAKELLLKVQQLYQQIGEPAFVVALDIDLMWVSNLEGNYQATVDKAVKVLTELQTITGRNNGARVVNEALFYLYYAEALVGTGQIEQGLAMYVKANQEITPLNSQRYQMWLMRSWSQSLAIAGDYANAYQKLLSANQLQEQLSNLAKQQREALLRYQFDTDRQAEKNDRLQLENQLSAQQVLALETVQRWQYIAIALFVLLTFIALFYARSQIFRNRQLHQLAMTDELTQVANRRSILLYAQQTRQLSVQQKKHWCLLLIDIDFFKQCNDDYGHEAGDSVLVQVSQAMKTCLRSSDRLGRTGGEEFLLVLSDTELAAAVDIAERLRLLVAELDYPGYSSLRVTVSIGATQALASDDVREAMSRADRALYQAKASGRNRVVVA